MHVHARVLLLSHPWFDYCCCCLLLLFRDALATGSSSLTVSQCCVCFSGLFKLHALSATASVLSLNCSDFVLAPKLTVEAATAKRSAGQVPPTTLAPPQWEQLEQLASSAGTALGWALFCRFCADWIIPLHAIKRALQKNKQSEAEHTENSVATARSSYTL